MTTVRRHGSFCLADRVGRCRYLFGSYQEGLVPYVYESEVEFAMSLMTNFTVDPSYCITGHAEEGAYMNKSLVECWELCASSFDCHSFDYRSLSLGDNVSNCELTHLRAEDVAGEDYRNCSAFPSDVEFQYYEKNPECVPYTAEVSVDVGKNVGEGGSRTVAVEDNLFGKVL